jgi:hypothetical protein
MRGSKNHVIPPPMANILHRKLMGVFLLSAHLGARVNVQKLVRPYLSIPGTVIGLSGQVTPHRGVVI